MHIGICLHLLFSAEIGKLRSKGDSSGAATSSPFLTVDEWAAVSTKNEDAPSDDFRQGFEEFVRLKKENRTLKMQVRGVRRVLYGLTDTEVILV
jgi:hypothetical protein